MKSWETEMQMIILSLKERYWLIAVIGGVKGSGGFSTKSDSVTSQILFWENKVHISLYNQKNPIRSRREEKQEE